jgi:GT2 family glycosyltransferase
LAAPRFSIVTPVYETPAGVLRAMLRSVRRQRFRDWELCVVDDASAQPHVAEILAAAQRREPRIRVRHRDANGGIVASSNEALAMARGEFVVLLDHDDKLHPDALSLVAEALDRDPEADYIYTDEDKIDRLGLHTGPFCKPDWAPERMRTQMYTCHLSVLRRALVEEVGGFDPEFEGSQDWDLVLKVTERARSVAHVPRVLYHWRALETSTAGGGEAAKPWAFAAGSRAIQAHCDRIGLQARVERDEGLPGVYHLQPALTREPTVSIVIPTNGQQREVRYQQVTLVEHCVRSIVETSTYSNYEIVCVADSTTDSAVIDSLTALAGDRLRVVEYDREFNFSAKINLGASQASGELLLLLNDDMEVVSADWLERMAMYGQHPGIGAVGGRLLWEDGRLQHVGVLFENGGLPGHIYRGFSGDFKGYANNTYVAQNFLAVTGACMMTRAAAFAEVGGLNEELAVNYNDMDYCLKLREKGLRVVYDPDTILYHFESSSRSSDVEEWEKEALVRRWLPMTGVDPSTSPYLVHGLPRLAAHFAWAARRLPRLSRLEPPAPRTQA